MRLPASLHPVLATLCVFLSCAPLTIFVHAQSTPSASATQSASSSLSVTTSNFTTTITTVAGQNTRILTSVLPTTITLTPTTTANATAATNTSTPSATPISLDTRIDPGFGVLGAILILTGLPSTFWGHKNRWYARSLDCWMPHKLTLPQVKLLPYRLLLLRSRMPGTYLEVWCPRGYQSA